MPCGRARPGRTVRRFGRAAIAASAVAVLVAVVVAVDRALATREYADSRYGWAIDVPRQFDVHPFVRRHRVIADGALFATVPVEPGVWPTLRDLPGRAAAFLLYRFHGPVSTPASGPETAFPLSLADLGGAESHRPRSSGTWLRGSLDANGWHFVTEAWIGQGAPDGDVIALERLVQSLRFEPLREGTVTGEGFYVLGPADRYPVRSVTRFPARGLPISDTARLRDFFLVHAPRGFYAMAGTCDRPYGYAGCSWCEPRYDAGAREFFCAIGARWDRLGRVVVNPDPRRYRDDELSLLATKVAHDGHVLVGTNHGVPRHTVGDPWGRTD
jgi:hypothetical protein